MEILRTTINMRSRSLSLGLLAILLSVAIGSCRKKDATVKLPKVEPKLNVICFLSPQDTLLRVFVGRTQPLYNNSNANKFAPVTDAKVVISGNGLSVQLAYDPDREEYTGDANLLKVTEGQLYEISVSTPDGKAVNATSRVPGANNSLKYTYDKTSNEVKTRWTDPKSQDNRYRLLLVSSSYFLFEGYNQSGQFKDTIRTRYAAAYWAVDSDYDSPEIEYPITLSPYDGNEEDMYLYLLNVSEEYYNYNKKLETAQNTGNPFQEPTTMYSNVSGGVGVFAAFNSYSIKIQ